jgi:ABC-type antimicrobial peptide transport system permease subunit
MAFSFALTELVRSLLFGVEPTDPATLAAGAGVIVAAALAAAYIPARRATRIEPVTALRHE